jgi:hypothetical protein
MPTRALLIKIVVNRMTLVFLGASVRIFGMGGRRCVADYLQPQLQPIFARLTPNLSNEIGSSSTLLPSISVTATAGSETLSSSFEVILSGSIGSQTLDQFVLTKRRGCAYRNSLAVARARVGWGSISLWIRMASKGEGTGGINGRPKAASAVRTPT